MVSQSRAVKRTYSQSISEEGALITRSQPLRIAAARQKQSKLPFGQPTLRESSPRNTPTPPRERSPSLSPSQDSSILPSESASSVSRTRTVKIFASRRCHFRVDFSGDLDGYRVRPRTLRALGQGKISWIYLHGIEIEKKNEKGIWKRYWLCKHCHDDGIRKPRPNASTTSCSTHLSKHQIYPPGQGPQTPIPPSIDDFLDDQQHPLFAQRWQMAFIDWVVETDTTFEEATHPALRKLILTGCPIVKGLLPSRNTIRSWLMSTYSDCQFDVKESLHTARSKVVLSLDAWSAPNHLSLLGVVGHWLDESRSLKTALLGLRPMRSHTGADIATVVSEVITTYNLKGKVSAYQMDNATNNDTALAAMNSGSQTRLRCLGHIVNLVVKALLFGTMTSAFQKELREASDEDAFKLWRQHGAIGRLHNLVTYIMRSDGRLREFEATQKVVAGDLERTLHLKKDFGVRWNSTYYMIQRALRLQSAIQRYCRDWRPAKGEQYDLKKDFLDPQDWEELRHFEELLHYFEKATRRVEGNAFTGSHGALWEVLPTMDYLFAKLKKHSDEVSERPDLFTDYYMAALNHGFAKLSEYYTKVDESPYYAAAVALHPCRRFTYFDNNWSKTTGGDRAICNAKQATKRLFEEYLTRAITERESSSEPEALFISNTTQSDDEDEDWATAFGERVKDNGRNTSLRRRQETELNRFMDDELDTYYTEHLHGKVVTMSYVDQPLRWWRERGEVLYPTLASMAYDLFAMPGMSSECERAFSAAKRMIIDERYNLKPDIIQAD